MSTVTVKICDIKDCEQLANHSAIAFMHGQQKGEDSYGAHIFKAQVDLCGSHEMEYRTSLPRMQLKAELADQEIEATEHQNPYGAKA